MIEEYLPAEIAGLPAIVVVILLGCFAFFWFVLFPIWMIANCVQRKEKSRWFKVLWVIFMIPTWSLGAWLYGVSASNKWYIRCVSWLGQLGVIALIVFMVWVGIQNRDKLPQILDNVNQSDLLENIMANTSEEEIEKVRELLSNAMKEQNQTSQSLKHLKDKGALSEILSGNSKGESINIQDLMSQMMTPKKTSKKRESRKILPNDLAKNEPEGGLTREYYDNGNIRSEAAHVNGLENGIYREYYNDGTLGAEGFKFNGQWDGVLTLYNEDGSVQDRIKYDNGRRID